MSTRVDTMRGASRAAAVAFLVFAAASGAFAEEGKSGMSPERLSLPKGPGSLEGVGENAEPDLNMGLVRYGVPLELPAGYGGHGPSLRLAYSSGSGNSEVGLGWSLGVPAIERMTARGLPRYQASDLFAAHGGEELVRLGSTATYRSRYEGGFVRYTWVDPMGQSQGRGGYWTAEYPDGRVGYFGADRNGTLEPSSRLEDASLGTFRYGLCETVDVHGHRVRYVYTKELGQPYLSQVEWVGTGTGARYRVELAYESRPDALSDGKPGFVVVTAKRLAGVRVLVRGQLLRRYALSYEDASAGSGLSRLVRVTRYGMDETTAHPAVQRFSYSGTFDPTCAYQAACALPSLTTLGSAGVSFKTKLADLIDLDGDALPDVVDTTGGVHVFHLARRTAAGEHVFAAPRGSSVATGGAVVLSSAWVQTVDLNGDGFTDLVDGANDTVLWNEGTGEWRRQSFGATSLPKFAEDANLRFFDYDHDRAPDVVHNDGANTWFYRNRGDGTFAPGAVDGEAWGWGFASHGAELADLNGDGMQDLVLVVGAGLVAYRAHLGWGRLGPIEEMFGLPENLEASSVQLVDLNGDSLADAVVVLGSEVRYALNENGERFGALQTIAAVDGGSIPQVDATVSVRFADMNGSGSTDIVWIDLSGTVTYLELYPRRANLLTRIENSLGKVVELGYGTSVEHLIRDGGATAWGHRLPQAMQTLDGITTYDELSGVRQERALRYHEGYYDGGERQFRGFGKVEVASGGDTSVEAGEVRYAFEVGASDRYRKGLLVSEEQASGGEVLRRTAWRYEDCPLSGVVGPTAVPVRFVCKRGEEQVLVERRPEAEWVRTATDYEYDGYGNVVRTAQQGVVSAGGDESYERVEYVSPEKTGGRWLLRAAYRRQRYGSESGPKTETLTYYDGEAFAGLGLGELTAGLVTRETERIESESAAVVTRGTAYDEHGNPVEVRDGNGHARRFGYDADGLLLLSEEVVLADAGHAPYSLRLTVERDAVHEGVTGSTSWERIEGGASVSAPRWTRYGYDVHGRLTKVARPGDELALPTQVVSYELGRPVSRIVTKERSDAGSSTYDLESVQCFDGLGRGYQSRTRVAASQYQVDGFKAYNAQGYERAVFQPYVESSGACSTAAPLGVRAVRRGYDATGRVLGEAQPDGELYGSATVTRTVYGPQWVRAYDGEDNAAASVHRETPATTRSDGLGRTVALERLLEADGEPLVTRLSYDGLGRLASVVDARGNARQYRHDLLGRLVEVVDPDAGTWRFAYDAAGNRTQATDGRGETVRRAYDEANRVVAEWDAKNEAGTKVTYTYDALPGCSACTELAGQLGRVSFPVDAGVRPASRGVEVYGYDARGRRVYTGRQLWGVLFATRHAHDNADRLVATTHPNGATVRWSLDAMGRTVGVPGYVERVAYTVRNQREELALANGVRTMAAYDARLRLKGLLTLGPGNAVLQDYSYRHDRVGNVLSVADGRNAATPTADAEYGYDALYRLTSAALDTGKSVAETIGLTYDEIDNLTSMTSSVEASRAHVGSYRYGENGAGPHAVSRAGSWGYRYDAAGNVAQRNGETFAWDFAGRLVQVKRGAQTLAQYAYGVGRERVVKREGAHVSLYVSPDFEVRDGVSTLYVRVDGERVAKVESLDFDAELLPDTAPAGNRDGTITGGDAYVGQQEGRPAALLRVMQAVAAKRALLQGGRQVTYLHHNHLGTASVTTDEAGAVVQRTEHYPYGEERWNSGYREDYTWTGQERDRAAGLSFHGARHLDTYSTRWTQPDPLFLTSPEAVLERPVESTNLYQYCGGNPVSNIDPDGLNSKDAWEQMVLMESVAGEKYQPQAPSQMMTTMSSGSRPSGVAPYYPSADTTRFQIQQQNERAAAAVAKGVPLAGVLVSAGEYLTGQISGSQFAKEAAINIGITALFGWAASGESAATPRLVIGRGADLSKPGALQPGEFKLSWPPTATAKSEWKINAGLMRQEMHNMRPIRDASPGDLRGMYLNAERNLLESRGWMFDKSTNLWMPPKG